MLLHHLPYNSGRAPGISPLELEVIQVAEEEHVVVVPFRCNLQELAPHLPVSILLRLFEADLQVLRLVWEPVDGKPDHEPEDLVHAQLLHNLREPEAVDRRPEPGKLDHLLPYG